MVISKDNKAYLLSLTPDDLSLSLFIDLLGYVVDNGSNNRTDVRKPKFNIIDTFELAANEYNNKTKIVTTVGKFIFNKYVLEGTGLEKITGYVNWELTEGGLNNLEAILDEALLTDKIKYETYVKYIDYRDTLGQQMHSIICPSFTMNILKTPPDVRKRRDELFKQNAEKFKAGDIVAASATEKELLDLARVKLKGDPGMQLYNSEARGNFKNNYKNNNIMKGSVYNHITDKYDIVQSNLMDGIKKEDLPAYSNAIVAGEYQKAVGTKVSGYTAKKLIAALQTEVIGKRGSDCGSKAPMDVTIPDKTYKDYLYMYIVEDDKLICLSPDVITKYIGKTVKLRTPMSCVADIKCNICMGDMFYMEEVENIGLHSATLAGTLVGASMKSRHDMSVKLYQLDPDEIIL